jgi:hypothetical protein
MADISKNTFSAAKRYRKVLIQQKKPLMDFEFNELQDIAAHERDQLGKGLLEGLNLLGTAGRITPTGVAREVAVAAGIGVHLDTLVRIPVTATLAAFASGTSSGTQTSCIYVRWRDVEVTFAGDADIYDPVFGESAARTRREVEVLAAFGATSAPTVTGWNTFSLGTVTHDFTANGLTLTNATINQTYGVAPGELGGGVSRTLRLLSAAPVASVAYNLDTLNNQTADLLQLRVQGAIVHRFTRAGGAIFTDSVTMAGANGAYATTMQGSLTASQSFGLLVRAGTNASDVAFRVQNASAATNLLNLTGSGILSLGTTAVGSATAGGIRATGVSHFSSLHADSYLTVSTAATRRFHVYDNAGLDAVQLSATNDANTAQVGMYVHANALTGGGTLGTTTSPWSAAHFGGALSNDIVSPIRLRNTNTHASNKHHVAIEFHDRDQTANSAVVGSRENVSGYWQGQLAFRVNTQNTPAAGAFNLTELMVLTGSSGGAITMAAPLTVGSSTFGGSNASFRDISGIGSGGRGAGIALGGVSNENGPVFTDFVRMLGLKTNATQGDTQGYLSIATNGGSGLIERARVTANGTLLVGTTAAGSTTAGGIRATGVSQFDAAVSVGGNLDVIGGLLDISMHTDGSGNVRIQSQASKPLLMNPLGNEVQIGSGGLRVTGTSQFDGNFQIGTSTSPIATTALGVGRAQIHSPSYASLQMFGNTGGVDGSYIALWKTRSGTTGVQTGAVLSGDTLGGVWFGGSDGTTLVTSATVQAQVDGAPSAGVIPTRLVFQTSSNGAPGERMRITNGGTLLIGTTSAGNTTAGGIRATGASQFDSYVTVAGVAQLTSGLQVGTTHVADGPGVIGYRSNEGLWIQGRTGIAWSAVLVTPEGSGVWAVPVGTNNTAFFGDLILANNNKSIRATNAAGNNTISMIKMGSDNRVYIEDSHLAASVTWSTAAPTGTPRAGHIWIQY